MNPGRRDAGVTGMPVQIYEIQLRQSIRKRRECSAPTNQCFLICSAHFIATPPYGAYPIIFHDIITDIKLRNE